MMTARNSGGECSELFIVQQSSLIRSIGSTLAIGEGIDTCMAAR